MNFRDFRTTAETTKARALALLIELCRNLPVTRHLSSVARGSPRLAR